MGKSSSGIRRKSRSALSKRVREKGRLPLSRLLTKYEAGEKAQRKTVKTIIATPEHIRKHEG
jgi:ribosomal protein L21E